MSTPFKNAQAYSDFLNELLFKLDPTVVDRYFSPNHRFVINEKNLHDGLFKQRIEWIAQQVSHDRIDLAKSHAEIVDFFISEDQTRLFERHHTYIFKPGFERPAKIVVSGALSFDTAQRITDINLVEFIADPGELGAQEAESGINAVAIRTGK